MYTYVGNNPITHMDPIGFAVPSRAPTEKEHENILSGLNLATTIVDNYLPDDIYIMKFDFAQMALRELELEKAVGRVDAQFDDNRNESDLLVGKDDTLFLGKEDAYAITYGLFFGDTRVVLSNFLVNEGALFDFTDKKTVYQNAIRKLHLATTLIHEGLHIQLRDARECNIATYDLQVLIGIVNNLDKVMIDIGITKRKGWADKDILEVSKQMYNFLGGQIFSKASDLDDPGHAATIRKKGQDIKATIKDAN